MSIRNRGRAAELLELAVARRERLVTDAEAFQDILHRCVAIDRRDAIDPAWKALRGLVDEVFPVEIEDVEAARRLIAASRLTARNALHVAVVKRRGVEEILSFDTDFDGVAGIHRRA